MKHTYVARRALMYTKGERAPCISIELETSGRRTYICLKGNILFIRSRLVVSTMRLELSLTSKEDVVFGHGGILRDEVKSQYICNVTRICLIVP